MEYILTLFKPTVLEMLPHNSKGHQKQSHFQFFYQHNGVNDVNFFFFFALVMFHNKHTQI